MKARGWGAKGTSTSERGSRSTEGANKQNQGQNSTEELRMVWNDRRGARTGGGGVLKCEDS